MSTTIRIDGLDSASIRQAISELRKASHGNSQDVTDVCMQIAEVGRVRAEADFAGCPYQGTKDVTVTTEPMQGGARLIASGETVAFLEYGSGAYNPAYLGDDPYGRGSWSTGPEGKGHWDDPNGWYYAHGQRSMGNPPANAMFHAEQDMRRRAESINGAAT